jgi:RNA polymerase sigma-70 factor (ECF subfamily)
MDPSNPLEHLSQIETLWSMVLRANQGPDASATAQDKILKRYGGVVHRYLLGLVRDPHVADDLSQEFALRFLRGDFRNAHPDRGRFRNFVKSAIRNLVTDFYRRKKAQPANLPLEAAELVGCEPPVDLDEDFLASWRQELLARAWDLIKQKEERAKQPFYTALRLRADRPELRSAQLAEEIGRALGRAVSDTWVRQVLFRARNLFAAFLLDDVIHSLENPTLEQAREELSDLGLLSHCSDALDRRFGDDGTSRAGELRPA